MVAGFSLCFNFSKPSKMLWRFHALCCWIPFRILMMSFFCSVTVSIRVVLACNCSINLVRLYSSTRFDLTICSCTPSAFRMSLLFLALSSSSRCLRTCSLANSACLALRPISSIRSRSFSSRCRKTSRLFSASSASASLFSCSSRSRCCSLSLSRCSAAAALASVLSISSCNFRAASAFTRLMFSAFSLALSIVACASACRCAANSSIRLSTLSCDSKKRLSTSANSCAFLFSTRARFSA
mmetsp:Transcript_29067/g.57061  ORF Transcript_29067/g.57061 Transcript_29067/m.57061 type:complete len:240 (+) Transcript_29067:1873-2592(+)